MRVLQALLVSLALAVVLTPPASATPLREAAVRVLGPAAGSPPPAQPRVERIAAARVLAEEVAAPHAPRLEPALPSFPTPVLVRNLLLFTSRILR